VGLYFLWQGTDKDKLQSLYKMPLSKKPYRSEYGDFYADYVEGLPDQSLMQILPYQNRQFVDLLSDFNEQTSIRTYEPGKWSVKEILGHLADTELIFQYRALTLARGEKNLLPGYDQDHYVLTANFDNVSLNHLLERIRLTREITISFFHSFTPIQLMRAGVVNDNPLTVRAIGFVIAGHELHHMRVIKQKYLSLT